MPIVNVPLISLCASYINYKQHNMNLNYHILQNSILYLLLMNIQFNIKTKYSDAFVNEKRNTISKGCMLILFIKDKVLHFYTK